MGTKRTIGRALPKNAPNKLERFLFPEGLPKYMPRLKNSPELMTIFYLLFASKQPMADFNESTHDWEVTTESTLEGKMRTIINADTREVVLYKSHTAFRIIDGEFCPMAELPLYMTPGKARQVEAGDVLLLRVDQKDLKEHGVVEVQVLTNGLFGSDDDDFRCFKLRPVDFANYLKYIKKEN